MKHSVKFGIVGGLSAVVITVLFYVTGLNLSSMWGAAITGLLMMVVFGVVAVMSVKEERAANGGAITLKSAFVNGFVCLFVGFFISVGTATERSSKCMAECCRDQFIYRCRRKCNWSV